MLTRVGVRILHRKPPQRHLHRVRGRLESRVRFPAFQDHGCRSVFKGFPLTGALQWNLMTEQNYMAGELVSPVKHEYIGGSVHAMAGAGNRKNTIAVNITGELRTRLKGDRASRSTPHQDTHPPPDPYSLILPGCVSGLSLESRFGFIPGRFRGRGRGAIQLDAPLG